MRKGCEVGMINNLSRTDIIELLNEYEPFYYKGTDFKEKAKKRILDGATYSELGVNADHPGPNPLYVFQLELRNFGNWAWNKLHEMEGK